MKVVDVYSLYYGTGGARPDYCFLSKKKAKSELNDLNDGYPPPLPYFLKKEAAIEHKGRFFLLGPQVFAEK